MNKKLVSFLTGLFLSLALTFVSVLLFAVLIEIFGWSSKVVAPVNQVIKIIAVTVGAFFAIKEKGAVTGLIFGLLYVIITDLLFALIAGSLDMSLSVLWEVLFGGVTGVIAGGASANIQRN